jgi:nitroreductase
LADHLVLTRCAHSQLRRMLSDLGMAAGANLMAAMHALGMYLVGVGELITPTPKEVLRQAKVVGQAISAKVYPNGLPTLLPAGFALAAPA